MKNKFKELLSELDETDDFSYIDTDTVYIKHKLKKVNYNIEKNNTFKGVNYEEKDR